jgi:hypothetical protein
MLAISRTQFCLLGLIGISLLISHPANAVTAIAGQVGNIETVGAGGGASGNYDFRVFLATGEVICNGQNWAYLNTTDANYSALVAHVFLAKGLGLTVTLYVNQVGAYCQLAYLVTN